MLLRYLALLCWLFCAFSVLCLLSSAQNSTLQDAPAAAANARNPYGRQPAAIRAGKEVYQRSCAGCHGALGEGTGNVPPLAQGATQSTSDGAVFWFITRGAPSDGMPSWAAMPANERWEVVTYIKSLDSSVAPPAAAQMRASAAGTSISNAPRPQPPFTDYRFEQPGTFRKITANDLPEPYATAAATNGPRIVQRPETAWPKAPAGFKVELYASGLNNPRLIRTAPNGDFFLAETTPGNIKVFRGITKDGKPKQISVFASGLTIPFGIAFYPPGPNPQWLYVANMNSIVRFPYHNGDLTASGPQQQLAELPSGGHHRSRDIQFSPDGKKMFVSVGSQENVSDLDATTYETHRADILEYNPDGTGLRVYASGIRNAVGLAIDPNTGKLWCSVNERDGLGDNLVPDYITHVEEGGFYGWPWWYMGGHQDPRFPGKHPELRDRVITPDVLLQPHNASLEMTFYGGNQFPAEYRGDIFAAEHGSWNRSLRAGYEVIRVPLHQSDRASGEYEDFLTGFVVNDESVWGRPVGVTIATDGSLLVTDDGSGSIWRVTYPHK